MTTAPALAEEAARYWPLRGMRQLRTLCALQGPTQGRRHSHACGGADLAPSYRRTVVHPATTLMTTGRAATAPARMGPLLGALKGTLGPSLWHAAQWPLSGPLPHPAPPGGGRAIVSAVVAGCMWARGTVGPTALGLAAPQILATARQIVECHMRVKLRLLRQHSVRFLYAGSLPAKSRSLACLCPIGAERTPTAAAPLGGA